MNINPTSQKLSVKELSVTKCGHNKDLFWLDKWMGPDSLQGLFPDTLALAQHQHKTVAEICTQQGWNLVLKRH